MTSHSISRGSALRDAADTTPQTTQESAPTWNLGDLFPTARLEDLGAALERIEQCAKQFADSYKGKVASLTPEQLASAVEAYERVEESIARLSAFAELRFSAQPNDPTEGRLLQFVSEQGTSITNRLLFFTLEINRLDESTVATWQKHAAVRRWRPWLRDLRVFRDHQLSDDLEELLSDKDVIDRGWARLFDQTLAALRVSLCGEELTLSSALSRLSDARRQVRQETAQAMSRAIATIRPTVSLILNTLAKNKSITDKWRRYDKPVSHRNLSNMVEDEIVDALVAAVTAAYPRLSHRYYHLKARWLGLERLQHWDRNAPLADDSDQHIPWKDAVSHVTTSYERFSPELGGAVRAFLAQPWIDAALRPGKAGGAFSHPTVPAVHPYILMNYHGRPRDVMTLAHEVGHAIHQTFSAEQGYLLSSTPLTLAETASVFGEMLSFRTWLDREPNPHRRRRLLAEKIEDSLNTVVRQIAFYQFETRLHTERRSGELLPERIDELWLEVQKQSLGSAFDLTAEYGTYWTYIPHFVHSPFYVYAYAFGDCLVSALYSLYESGEPSFESKYLEMLHCGGIKRHRELLAPFGVDASDPAFWNRGLDLIAGWIDELEETSDA